MLDVPSSADRLEVTFRIESDETLPGHFWVGQFRLEPLESANKPDVHSSKALLTLSPVLADGTPTPARLYLKDSYGLPADVPFTFEFDGGKLGFHLSSLHLNRFAVLPGTYEVVAMKGFEYKPVRTTVTLEAGESKNVELILEPAFDASYRNWYSGDHHTHLFRHASTVHPFMNIDDVYRIAQGEGLAFVPFMGADRVSEPLKVRSEPGFLGWATNELTRDLWGHICPIGFDVPALPEYGNLWPMNVDYMAAAESAGGAIAYAHPYARFNPESIASAVSDPESGHAARELPLAAALGHRFTIDMLTKEGFGSNFGMKLRDYFRLLNLGFQLGVSGSTDFHADQGRGIIGAMRTYVHADPFTWPAVAQAYREGRTFATNGPLLFLSAGAFQPGDTVTLEAEGELTVAVEAFSHWGLTGATLWYNGRAVETWRAQGDLALLREHTFKVSHSGWVVLSATGPAHDELTHAPEGVPTVDGQFAITSPLYVTVVGRPAPADPEAARYFMAWVDNAKTAFETACASSAAKGNPLPEAIRDQALARFAEARSVYFRLSD
ncbi:MAG: hypothetical protein AMXMBFR84_12610 [Candidatus Hydrogenedentota bacterium]